MRILQVILLTLFLYCAAGTGNACTTFLINKNGQLVFGRNYDWVTGSGMVCVNLKGLQKTSNKTADGATITWISQFGSITFNQYGKEFPTGGMNEKGLVVELMWLDGTKYPTPDDRPALNVLQWIQFQLDNCMTIEDVITSDKKIRIASIGTTPLHYLVADANGNAATIEFMEGKMVVHRGNELPFPVLTNNSYEESIRLTSGAINASYSDNSIDRFAKACSMVKQFQAMDANESAVDYSFRILGRVAQGNYTKWSIVYDIANRKIHFRTNEYTDIKSVAFSGFNFDCSPVSKAWDMNQAGKGDVAILFVNFSLEFNQRIVERSFFESREMISVSEERKKETWQYAGETACTTGREGAK